MKGNPVFYKSLVVGVIVLFVGVGIQPAFADIVKEPYKTPSDGDTLYVGGSGEGNYTKIQDAVDDASDEDTVFVFDESSPYYENVVIYKSINLIGENRDTTVIDGNQIGIVVSIIADEVNISGFTIQNCSGGYNYAGIKIYSNHNIIRDNIICLNSEYASGISFSDYNSPSNNNTLIGNNIVSNKGRGILLRYSSDNNTITGNNISKNDNGIILIENSINNLIINNEISSNKRNGIGLGDRYGSGNNTITGNNINSNNENGIELFYSSNNNIIGNNISFNAKDAILLGHSCGNHIIGNNIFSNYGNGIYLPNSYPHSDYNTIKGNNIISNNYMGILMYSSSGNTITGNTISLNNRSGIYLYYYSNDNTIKGNNIISNNEYGIHMGSSSNAIKDNNIMSNNWDGLIIKTKNNNISGNNISYNIENGILLRSSSNTITENNINSNIEYGIKISGSNNLIYHNNFIENTDNAYDEYENIWNGSKYGNYWSDYEENYPDANKLPFKGIWDTPYKIEGGDNKDSCPLIKQWPKSRTRTSSYLWFELLLDRFPLLERLLTLLLL